MIAEIFLIGFFSVGLFITLTMIVVTIVKIEFTKVYGLELVAFVNRKTAFVLFLFLIAVGLVTGITFNVSQLVR